ncbi:hypothetical protein B842_03490 [Corynebacterium humireducens NBRC 106098 = DSM 45392]|uniref:Uncharacterized protein n=1 Tax=Corynebacterium humireducens NBRC 106098 = DSM 45392 TaxID=1223515 RepID=A0A0B5D1N3_9CORY|nr:hypothetical protein B842_03490 [Corynebacterium humireducens NBRC 106098 = DSM 45392]
MGVGGLVWSQRMAMGMPASSKVSMRPRSSQRWQLLMAVRVRDAWVFASREAEASSTRLRSSPGPASGRACHALSPAMMSSFA